MVAMDVPYMNRQGGDACNVTSRQHPRLNSIGKRVGFRSRRLHMLKGVAGCPIHRSILRFGVQWQFGCSAACGTIPHPIPSKNARRSITHIVAQEVVCDF